MKRNRNLSFFFAGLVGGSLFQTATSEGAGVLHCRGVHTPAILTIATHPDEHIEATIERTDHGYIERAAHFTSVKVDIVPPVFHSSNDDQPSTRYSAIDGKGNQFQATLSESTLSGHLKVNIKNTELRGAVSCQTQILREIY